MNQLPEGHFKLFNVEYGPDRQPCGWYCSVYSECFNDILSTQCKYCNTCLRPESLTTKASYIALKRRGDTYYMSQPNQPDRVWSEKSHIQFYNHGRVEASKKSIEETAEWIVELETRIKEAKSTVQGAYDENEERIGKLSKEERDKLITQPNFKAMGDKNTLPKRERTTRGDKLLDTLKAAGLEGDFIKSIMKGVKVSEAKSDDPAIALTDKRDPRPLSEPGKTVSSQLSLLNELTSNSADVWKAAVLCQDIFKDMPDMIKTAQLNIALEAETRLVEKYRGCFRVAVAALKESGKLYSDPGLSPGDNGYVEPTPANELETPEAAKQIEDSLSFLTDLFKK